MWVKTLAKTANATTRIAIALFNPTANALVASAPTADCELDATKPATILDVWTKTITEVDTLGPDVFSAEVAALGVKVVVVEQP